MTRRNGGHPGAVPLDARSLEAIAMLQPTRVRDCEGCGVTHIESLCRDCTLANGGVPVYHID